MASLVILLLLVGRYFIIGPYWARRDWVKTQLELQPELLQKNLRFIARKDELLAELEAARNEIKVREPRLLTGDTASVNASDLQDTVQNLATKEGTQVITTRVLNPESVGSFSKISIQMELGGQIDQLANLIKGIEVSPKLLIVDEINVRSLFRPAGFPQRPTTPQLTIQNLRVSLTVAGFARNQSSAASKLGGPTVPANSGAQRGG